MAARAGGGARATSKALSLYHENPQDAVFLRRLAWELYVADMERGVSDTVSGQLAAARRELGLDPYAQDKGGGHDYLQKLRKRPTPLISPAGTKPKPLAPRDHAWEKQWRILHVPQHDAVRRMVHDEPVVKVVENVPAGLPVAGRLITWRLPGSPTLAAYLGRGVVPSGTFLNPTGLYVMREGEKLYVGQTAEQETRLSNNVRSKNPQWWVFAAPYPWHQLSSWDALNAAESFLISFFAEVCPLSNGSRGRDQPPRFGHMLSEAISIAQSAAAAVLWCVLYSDELGHPHASIPFKRWKNPSWPACYTARPKDL